MTNAGKSSRRSSADDRIRLFSSPNKTRALSISVRSVCALALTTTTTFVKHRHAHTLGIKMADETTKEVAKQRKNESEGGMS